MQILNYFANAFHPGLSFGVITNYSLFLTIVKPTFIIQNKKATPKPPFNVLNKWMKRVANLYYRPHECWEYYISIHNRKKEIEIPSNRKV